MTQKKAGKSSGTKKQFEELQKEYHEIKNLLQRNHAEFQNYKKRTEEDQKRFVKLSNEELIKKLLPLLDNIELALSNKHSDKEDFVKGIEMIYAQLLDILEQEGLKKIPASGKFSPELHEAMLTQPSNEETGTILEELQKGYKLGERVLRHSKVKIAKKTIEGDKK